MKPTIAGQIARFHTPFKDEDTNESALCGFGSNRRWRKK